jgi:hypothetical protein
MDESKARKSAKDILKAEIEMLHRSEAAGEREGATEFARGGFRGAKWVVEALLGKHVKNELLREIRSETGKPIPHTVGLAQDGERYGFDSDAG